MESLDKTQWRLSVAPMMDWTDRHCRYFHRLLTRRTRLYTEMVTTGALLHGNVPRHLDFNPQEHPLALQLGGSDPTDLAHCARLAERWAYDEVNLNCGCPSERVQRGSFGACLMNEPQLVTECVKAMRDAVGLPITVKHRIGVDRTENYGFVRDFVGTVALAGCDVFIVHARNAWLQGISPKENRELPPLRYETVHLLKRDFPHLTIVLNGGLTTNAQIETQLAFVDGVMVGREAYRNPWLMADWDARFFHAREAGGAGAGAGAGGSGGAGGNDDHGGAAEATLAALAGAAPDRDSVEAAMVDYMERSVAAGEPWSNVARHLLGLRNGLPGARRWRQAWSDHRLKHEAPAHVAALARDAACEKMFAGAESP